MSSQVSETDRSGEALVQVCQRLGLEVDGAVLLRRGSNAVYRLASERMVLRVSAPDADPTEVGRQVEVARWLAASGVTAVRAVRVDQPIQACGHAVTLWELVGEGHADRRDQYGSTAELGRVLRQVHRLALPEGVVLPPLRPFDRIGRRLDRVTHLSSADRQLLTDRAVRLERTWAGLQFVLPGGPIHGDANVGNLLRQAGGGPAVLSDLDGFCVGPREWDLILTALYTDRYGWHTEAEYKEFVEAYGYDVRAWSGYEVLADVRELLMVLWNAGNAAASAEHARELARRLETLRTGRGRRAWSPL
jgi:Ser/Thr protein kinase RdoA (MazF antagonist)